MRACPSCYALNEDAADTCSACQSAMLVPATTAKGKLLSDAALRAAAVRKRYEEKAPSSADLTAQQWYNVCKFYPTIARKASAHSHRPLAHVGPDNPLDKTATRGPLLRGIRLSPPPDPEALSERAAIQSESA
jgi:hypothetical protein